MIFGVFSEFNGADLTGGSACGRIAGDTNTWQPTITELVTLKNALHAWQGNPFQCQSLSVNGSDGEAWLCQDDPCTTDDACCMADPDNGFPNGTGNHDCATQRFYCDHPGSKLKGCPKYVCGSRSGDCSCVQGQCLPLAAKGGGTP